MKDRVLRDPITRQTVTFQLTGKDTAGELLRAEVRLGANGRVPKHVHLRQDERVEVVSGELMVRIGSTERRVGPGEALDVPRRQVHLVRNLGEDEAVFLLEVRPARRMENAMRALFRFMGFIATILRRR